jgi:hypothetical protein
VNAQGPFCVSPIHEPSLSTVFDYRVPHKRSSPRDNL